jgi:glycosyltransferase involved in cell wall biosynthesis
MTRNILFVSHSAELNGAEQMLVQTLKKIDRQKFRPFLVIPKPGPVGDGAKRIDVETFVVPMKWWITEKSKVWKQPFAWLFNIKSIFQISKLIRERKINLVFSNSAVASSGAVAAKREGIPHVWSIHEILGGRDRLLYFLFGSRPLVWLIHGLSRKVIANSSATQSAFQKYKRVCIIYNGIELEEEKPIRRDDLKQEFGLNQGDRVLGIVGKIYEEKGQREVILATASLLPNLPNLKLLIVGAVKDKRYYLKLQKIVREQHLENRVVFTGFRKDIFDVLRLMDLLVVASRVDSFGRIIIDAMAVGVPVLALKSGGLPEVITAGENGFLVERQEPAAIADAIRNILQSPAKTASAVEAGFATVRERFSLKKQVEKVESILEECLE